MADGVVADVVTVEQRGDVAIVWVDAPPVNAINQAVRAGLQAAFAGIAADASVKAAVLACRGRTFMAGADIKEFDTGIGAPAYHTVFNGIEAVEKPVVAALHGTALGGGTEAALACHYRVADKGAKIGLPELSLGIIPGAGGTQRLPRLIGIGAALDVILGGKPVAAADARRMGLVDAVAAGDVTDAAVDFARTLVAEGKGPRRTRDLPLDTAAFGPDWFAAKRAAVAKSMKHRNAPQRAIDAVEAATTLPFEEGLALETQLTDACKKTTESLALRHVFFAERDVRRIPGLAADTPTRPIRSVGIIGAGTMGGGIAMCFVDAGIPVTLIDATRAGLDRGIATITKNYERMVQRGRIDQAGLEARLARITPALTYDALSTVDLVIEAVFEDMDLKKRIFGELDRVCRPGAILATNTSTLDIDEIATATARPGDVLGLHFFSPANVMPLLEIVRAKRTADDVLATALDIAKTIRKTGVVAGVCYGFIGNRLMDPYGREAERLVLEGAGLARVDGVLEDFGMAMGILAVYDMAGVDVGVRIREQRAQLPKGTPGSLPDDPTFYLPSTLMVERGRLGQKTGAGFYRYDPETRARQPDPEVEAIMAAAAAEHGIPRRDDITDQEILERCLFAMINEGAKVLEEGIALRAADIDVVYTAGYGFPRWRGGPMFHADTVGLATVLERILHFRETLDPQYWQPAPLLEKLARDGSSFAAWEKARSTADAA
ncbi:MAG: hypothetical protein RLY86_508 [Pseudomonadota bacterium]|jgi:3-hydroxyacyl-CoA dehydrogenase